MEEKQLTNLNKKMDRMLSLLEQLIAVEMCQCGATQRDIADNLEMSVGKVNKLVKGVKPIKDNHGKK